METFLRLEYFEIFRIRNISNLKYFEFEIFRNIPKRLDRDVWGQIQFCAIHTGLDVSEYFEIFRNISKYFEIFEFPNV